MQTGKTALDDALDAWLGTRAHAVGVGPVDGDSDLEPLRAIIGDAHVVSFGEGLHGGEEPLVFRNRLFRFLVERMGFTAIALESGLTEGFEVDRYVLGGPGELRDVVGRGLTSGFGSLAQNVELVRWMRAYNDDPAHARRKVEYYGMDLSGSIDGLQSTLGVAFVGLAAFDADAAAGLRARIADLLPRTWLDRSSEAPGQYTSLDQAGRDRLTATIADLVAALAIHEVEYARTGSGRAYEIALRAAIAARQMDEYLRRVPIGWKISQGFAAIADTIASADCSKADNVDWIRRQIGPEGRLLLFAHRDHLAGSYSRNRFPPHFDDWLLPPMVGEYLKRRYEGDIVTIGHFFASEAIRPGEAATEAVAGTLEARLARLPHRELLLDLRTAPPPVAAWLREPRELFGVAPFNTTILADAHDAIYFTRHVGPVTPA